MNLSLSVVCFSMSFVYWYIKIVLFAIDDEEKGGTRRGRSCGMYSDLHKNRLKICVFSRCKNEF